MRHLHMTAILMLIIGYLQYTRFKVVGAVIARICCDMLYSPQLK